MSFRVASSISSSLTLLIVLSWLPVWSLACLSAAICCSACAGAGLSEGMGKYIRSLTGPCPIEKFVHVSLVCSSRAWLYKLWGSWCFGVCHSMRWPGLAVGHGSEIADPVVSPFSWGDMALCPCWCQFHQFRHSRTVDCGTLVDGTWDAIISYGLLMLYIWVA
jgi:hypothetical protein